ncbi:MAG TPA: metallophosphoesterase family protein [Polyangiaceae bacterium]|nr:metallophosphoesterase family protein [Polyangiaceae bacterium]
MPAGQALSAALESDSAAAETLGLSLVGAPALGTVEVAGTPTGADTVPLEGAAGGGDAVCDGNVSAMGLREAEQAAPKKRAELKKIPRIRSAPYQSSCKNRLDLPANGMNGEADHDARAFARVGIVGDVHAEDEALELVLDDFARRDLGTILCVGDVADGLGDVNRCCALLEDRKVVTVIGNHDRWLLSGERRDATGATPRNGLNARSRAFLDALPSTRAFSTPYGNLLLCHGIGDDDMSGVKPDHLRHDLERNDALKRVLAGPRLDWMVNGHTHRAMVRRVRHLTIINAGTLHRNDERRACIVDFPERTATFFEVLPTGLSEHERVTLPDIDEWSRT